MDDRKFGDILADRRRRLGFTIEQAASATKLRPQALEAFERSDFAAMPPKGYAQGMLSSYARFLRLDPREVLEPYFDQLYLYERERDLQARSDRMSRYESYDQVSRRRSGVGRTESTYASRDNNRYLDDTHVVYTAGSRESQQRYRQTQPDRSYGNVYSRYSSGSSSPRRSSYNDYDNGYDDRQDYYDDYDEGRAPRSSRRPSRSASRYSSLEPIDSFNEYEGRGRAPRRGSARTARGNNGARQGGLMGALDNLPVNRNVILIALGAIVVIILLVIITSLVKSCSKPKEPVPAANTNVVTVQPAPAPGTQAPVQGTPGAAGAAGTQKGAAGTAGTEGAEGAEGAAQPEDNKTTVTFSVADGKESHVEVFLDGQNVYMATAKGPFSQSYTVKDQIEISATNPKNVTITQNGKKVAMKTTADVGSVKIKAKSADEKTESEN